MLNIKQMCKDPFKDFKKCVLSLKVTTYALNAHILDVRMIGTSTYILHAHIKMQKADRVSIVLKTRNFSFYRIFGVHHNNVFI